VIQVRHGRRSGRAISISDAQPSLEETQHSRKRIYAILMVIHLVGFTLAGVLSHIWWLALGIVVLTGPLPWVAVVIANDQPPRKRSEVQRLIHRPPAQETVLHASRELPNDGPRCE
jgi:hypothetical protein